MDAKSAETREETIDSLNAALAELEGGEGLSHFVGGHGTMSRLFEFNWSEPTLEIDFRLPYARVLADEESQKEDNDEINAAIRIALLLLTIEGVKAASAEEGLRASVWADERRVGYAISDKDGNAVDFGDDWSGLVNRLEAALPAGERPMPIIWP